MDLKGNKKGVQLFLTQLWGLKKKQEKKSQTGVKLKPPWHKKNAVVPKNQPKNTSQHEYSKIWITKNNLSVLRV